MPGFCLAFQGPYFHEFVLRCDSPVADVLAGLRQRGILGGVALGTWYPDLADCILVAVTETNSPADLDASGQIVLAVNRKGTAHRFDTNTINRLESGDRLVVIRHNPTER